eukprot:scaffold501563_cov20-Prasinocladus_malaysianus.AAC.1
MAIFQRSTLIVKLLYAAAGASCTTFRRNKYCLLSALEGCYYSMLFYLSDVWLADETARGPVRPGI